MKESTMIDDALCQRVQTHTTTTATRILYGDTKAGTWRRDAKHRDVPTRYESEHRPTGQNSSPEISCLQPTVVPVPNHQTSPA